MGVDTVISLMLLTLVIRRSDGRCLMNNGVADCRRKALHLVPDYLPNDTDTLDLSHNLISVLHQDDVNRYAQLRSVSLRSNRVSRIENDTFSTNVLLRNVVLSDNRLSAVDIRLKSIIDNLDLSLNRIPRFKVQPSVRGLNLSGNIVSNLSDLVFPLNSLLEELDLSRNNLTVIPASSFIHLTNLRILKLNDLRHLFQIDKAAFVGLESLTILEIRNNPRFRFIHQDLFANLKQLRDLDLINNNLTSFYAETYRISTLQKLSIDNNPLVCNCALHWLLFTKIKIGSATKCSEPISLRFATLQELHKDNLTCVAAKIVNYTRSAFYKVGSQAVLKCVVDGDPAAKVTWRTPDGRLLVHNDYLHDQWNTLPSKEDVLNDLYHSSGAWQSNIYRDDGDPKRIQLLSNGDLFISYVQRNDAGDYTCTVINPGGNDTQTLSFLLNYTIIKDVTIASMIVGFSSAGIFFGFGLLVAFVRYIVQKCAERQRKKSKSIKKIIGHLDTYRSQQMDKLRDSYGGHMVKMKEHAFGQMDKMRENYFTQIARIQEKCALQMDRLRENYNSQMTKIKGYSGHQIDKIRDNYSSQMIKIRDYGSTQLEKLRETYKLQHQHMMKILEAMNIDNCRGIVDSECMRANSMLFETRFSLDEIDINLENITLDNIDSSKLSSRNSVSISEDFLTANSSEGISLASIDMKEMNINVTSELLAPPTIDNASGESEDGTLSDYNLSFSQHDGNVSVREPEPYVSVHEPELYVTVHDPQTSI